MLTDAVARDPAKPSGRQAAPATAQGASNDANPPRPSATPAASDPLSPANATQRFDEQIPPKGRGNLLSDGEIRYCLAQIIRIDAIRPLLDRYEKEEVEYFNALVADYNSRCANYRYRGDALDSGKAVVEANRAQIETDARTGYLQHFGSARKSAKSTNGPAPTPGPKRAEAPVPPVAAPQTRPSPELKKETVLGNAPTTTQSIPKPPSQAPSSTAADNHPAQGNADADKASAAAKPKPMPSAPQKVEQAPPVKPADSTAEARSRRADEEQKKDTASNKPTPPPPTQAQKPLPTPQSSIDARVSQAGQDPKRASNPDKPAATSSPPLELEGPISTAPPVVATPAMEAKPDTKPQAPADKPAAQTQPPAATTSAARAPQAAQEAKKESAAVTHPPSAPPASATDSSKPAAGSPPKPDAEAKKETVASPPSGQTQPSSNAAAASPASEATVAKPDPREGKKEPPASGPAIPATPPKSEQPSTATTPAAQPKSEQPSAAATPSATAAKPDSSAAKPSTSAPATVAAVTSSTASDGALAQFAHDVEKVGSQVLTADKTREGGATTQIEVRYAAGGFIRSIVVSESSGNPVLDEKALEIARGLRFPDVPETLRARDFAVRFPIVFRAQKS